MAKVDFGVGRRGVQSIALRFGYRFQFEQLREIGRLHQVLDCGRRLQMLRFDGDGIFAHVHLGIRQGGLQSIGVCLGYRFELEGLRYIGRLNGFLGYGRRSTGSGSTGMESLLNSISGSAGAGSWASVFVSATGSSLSGFAISAGSCGAGGVYRLQWQRKGITGMHQQFGDGFRVRLPTEWHRFWAEASRSLPPVARSSRW